MGAGARTLESQMKVREKSIRIERTSIEVLIYLFRRKDSGKCNHHYKFLANGTEALHNHIKTDITQIGDNMVERSLVIKRSCPASMRNNFEKVARDEDLGRRGGQSK